MSDPAAIYDLIETGGVIAVLLTVLAGLIRGWLVPGKWHEDTVEDRDKQIENMRKDRDMWRDMALRGIATAETAVRQRNGHS